MFSFRDFVGGVGLERFALLALDSLLFNPAGGEVLHEQHHEHHDEDEGGQGVHARHDAATHLRVDEGRERVDAATAREVADDEVVEAHRERQQEARHNARHELG